MTVSIRRQDNSNYG